MGSFLGGLGHIIKTGFDLTETGHRFNQDKQEKEDRDNQITKFAVENGARPVMGGMVNEDGILRPPDKSRVITHKRADGQKQMLELATPEEQRKRKVAANVQTILDEFQGTTGMRKTQGDESVDIAGRQQTARNTANRTDEENNRNTNGITIPASLAEGLGLSPEEVQKHGKYLPGELSALANVDDNIQQAAARKAKPTKTVQATKEIEDDNGNVSQVVTYNDGTSETKSLGAIGKKTKKPELTPYQQWQMNRQTKLDSAKKTQDQKDLQSAQREVDSLEAKQTKIRGTHDKAQGEYLALQTGLNEGKFGKPKTAQWQNAQKELEKLSGKMAGAQTEHAALQSQKEAANKRRESLMKGGGTADSVLDDEATPQTGNAALAATQRAASPVTVPLPNGQFGVFNSQKEADTFKKQHNLK